MQQAPQALNEVRLPRAIREQSERVNLKLAELTKGADLPADPDAPPAAPDANAASATPAATTPNPPDTPPADPRHADPKYWMQRFEVMMGVLQKERREHAEEIERMESQVTELETRVSTLETENTALKQNPSPSSSIDIGQFFSPEDVERIGEDEATAIVQVAMKAAQQAVDKAVKTAAPVAPTSTKASTREDRDAEREFRAAKQHFLDKLAEGHVDFFEVDKSQGWGAWLAEPVKAGSKKTRQDVLDAAVRTLDHEGAVELMSEYKASLVPPPPPIAAHAEGGQNDDAGAPTPPRGAQGAPTNAEVRSFYARAALGKVTQAERAAFEAREKLRIAARR